MLNYYLTSFGKIDGTINISKELGINISNIDEKDKKIIFHHLNGSLSILEDNYIKDIDQLDGLIKLSFNSKTYDDLLLKGKKIDQKRKMIYKEEPNYEKRLKKDKKLYVKGMEISQKLLGFHDTQKNYLNTLLMCCLLNDFLIDLGNFTINQKIKFDNDLNFQDTFKPLLENGIEYSNGRQYLKYLEFDNFKSQLIDIGNTIDTTIGFYNNRQKFVDDLIHIGGLIQIYLLSNTDKIKITSLISILEYLLVREPSSENVCRKQEDGITKQFTLKVHEIIKEYRNFTNIKLKDLKKIYEIRSNIVHGNKKKNSNLEDRLYKSKTIVYLVLNKRIKQPEYFEVLKNIKKMRNDNNPTH